MLKWVIERVAGVGDAVDTPIGRIPTSESIDTSGLEIEAATMAKILDVDAEAWRQEIPQIEAHYEHMGDHLPDELRDELRELEKRLAN